MSPAASALVNIFDFDFVTLYLCANRPAPLMVPGPSAVNTSVITNNYKSVGTPEVFRVL